MPVALITGASRGLGLALARSLADDGWSLVVDARHAAALDAAAADLRAHGATEVVALVGSVTDAAHPQSTAVWRTASPDQGSPTASWTWHASSRRSASTSSPSGGGPSPSTVNDTSNRSPVSRRR